MRPATTVVVITRDRAPLLLATLERLTALPDAAGVVVVDNASGDGTAQQVRASFPDVDVVRLPENLGSAARTCGTRVAATPYVAFSDDDSWWEPGALARAADVLHADGRVGLVVGRTLVGADDRDDPLNALLAASPLPADDLPGPRVLGFLACAAVVRRDAYLAVGGFQRRFGVGGEEDVLAIDLARAGWSCCYVRDVVNHHHPAPGDRHGRRRREVRNALWTAWLRHPADLALARTAAAVRAAAGDADARRGMLDALRDSPAVLRDRRAPGPALARAIRSVQSPGL